jgi:hypothetical protein
MTALAAIAYTALRDPPPTQSPQESVDSAKGVARSSPVPGSKARDSAASAAVTRNASAEPSDAATLAASNDYYDFAASVVDRAKAGDANAQYALYAALAYCDETYRAFFRKPNGTSRTLDEALQRVSTRPEESVENVRAAHTRCAKLNDSGKEEFGAPSDWLRLATEQEQPLALATTADALLINVESKKQPTTTSSDAATMLLTAVKSKDPEVMWKIGDAQELLDGTDEEQRLRKWSWWLAACQRGYDCENSRWMEFSCRFDHMCAQDKDATDFIRRLTGLDFPEIESRAKQINAAIDSESWDALGLAPGR